MWRVVIEKGVYVWFVIDQVLRVTHNANKLGLADKVAMFQTCFATTIPANNNQITTYSFVVLGRKHANTCYGQYNLVERS